MQAVQDLTVEDRVSRTQYQYSLEHPDQGELARWGSRLLDALRREPALRDVATDQQTGGLRADIAIDRDTASRFGITAQTVDDALYSAFGQRQVSTIFTQLNQYHVILEVGPGYRRGPDAVATLYVPATDGSPVPLQAITQVRRTSAPLIDQPPGTVSSDDAFVQSHARRVARRGGQGGGGRLTPDSACRPDSGPGFKHARRSRRRSPTKGG